MSKNTFQQQFESQGYCVLKNAIPSENCRALIAAFRAEVKEYGEPLLRASSARMEKHHRSEAGLITNPLLNYHLAANRIFDEFTDLSLGILAQSELQDALRALIGQDLVLVQCSYYESGTGTVPHVDSHFFDSLEGTMVGCWIALEQITKEGGVFTVVPKSHLLASNQNISEVQTLFQDYEKISLDVIRRHQRSDEAVSLSQDLEGQRILRKLMREGGFAPVELELNTGDVVLFSANIFHGSTAPTTSGMSRNSLTGHFVHASKGFIRFKEKEESLNSYEEGGLKIHSSA